MTTSSMIIERIKPPSRVGTIIGIPPLRSVIPQTEDGLDVSPNPCRHELSPSPAYGGGSIRPLLAPGFVLGGAGVE